MFLVPGNKFSKAMHFFSVWIIAVLPPRPYPLQPRSQAGTSFCSNKVHGYAYFWLTKAHSPELTSDRPESYVLLPPSHVPRHRKVTGEESEGRRRVHISPFGLKTCVKHEACSRLRNFIPDGSGIIFHT
ncbi:hypothetical protein L1987_72722 [Smallanthus sonchifolius]|uniref:Uncharacterized protein n=1 Tax=Smallanthus sonchifolius TaxID=185202 RepID=A0ACB9AW98_9ASTR|nr:hypothetical protein L1987_72722 [Smallanthus sonchifolius]